MSKQPTFYVPHGGGPCFSIDWPNGNPWQSLGDFLTNFQQYLPQKPSAIVVMSGHWEEDYTTVSTNPKPSMLYDYYGFPEHTYQLQYPAPGEPELALRIKAILKQQNIAVHTDAVRGFDHGVFVPFMLMFPKADIPIVQISMQSDLSPEYHYQLGKVLGELRDENILIISCGMSFHNLRMFFGDDSNRLEVSTKFGDWLIANVLQQDSEKRKQQLFNWHQAPAARLAHPREEHLIPLFFALGAAHNESAKLIYNDVNFDAKICSFQFG